MIRQTRRRVDSVSSTELKHSEFTHEHAMHSHVSTYRSSHLEVHLSSPSVKTNKKPFSPLEPMPVYGEHDQIIGKVCLNSNCGPSGRLVISIEGAFLYNPQLARNTDMSSSSSYSGRRKHVFLASSTFVNVSPGSEAPLSQPRSAFTFNQSLRRRPSASSLNLGTSREVDRHFSYVFDLPRSTRAGEELPPTFSSDDYDIVYQVRTCWESIAKTEAREILEIPFIFQPDMDFSSLDGSSLQPESWLEMPLRSDRPIPFKCAVTLPSPVTFSRSSPIPYFVVFTTTPRSAELAQEIAADATISVSILRQITITESPSLPPSPPITPSVSSDEFDTSSRTKLLKRVKNSQTVFSWTSRTLEELQTFGVKEKPLPCLPAQAVFTESRVLQTSMSIGFPKRPRQRHGHSPRSHPPLSAHMQQDVDPALPDGLLKGKIQLDSGMLPFVDWAGVSVKYYLDLSVLIGNDDLRARIPIRLM